MNLKGIGIDIVDIHRIERLFNLYSQVFVDKILGQDEKLIYFKLQHSLKKISYLAKRFAAKEAIVKAFGYGMGIISLKDIQILNNHLGQPQVILKNVPLNECSISISDTHTLAIAVAIITQIH